jgi:hypothetical protein
MTKVLPVADRSSPAVACFLNFQSPWAFGLQVFGDAHVDQFERALKKAIARLTLDFQCARKFFVEGGKPVVSQSYRCVPWRVDDGRHGVDIEIFPTMPEDEFALIVPEIEQKARQLYAQAARRTEGH